MGFSLRSKGCSRQVALSAAVALCAAAGVYARGTAHEVASGQVRAVCRLSPAGSFEAKSHALSGGVAVGSAGRLEGELTLDLRTFETGIGLRDSHLREYLEVERPGHEQAVLTAIQVEGVGEHGFTSGTYPFRGRLRFHGREQDVSGTVQLRVATGRVRAQASFPIRLSEYGIERPAYLGIGVKDDLDVHVTLDAKHVQLVPGEHSGSREAGQR